MNNNIKPVIADEFLNEYMLDYGYNVITDRALPDLRDGLKPVQRRIIYDAYELNLTNDKKHKKSARIVGDVLGKYHPHGDSSVYEALVRMAQPFTLRYPLIDGQGNFGNEDGDSPASQRYTEARLQKISGEMLNDIKKDTVDFMPNFDGEEQEPTVLPSRIPNLLINGANGIAIGFSTNIPSHNLKDSILQIIHQIDNPDCSIDELVEILKAPDFATGGEIVNQNQLVSMYKNGYGTIKVRGKYHVDGNKIIFTELPYQVNKAKLFDLICDLAYGYYKKVGKKQVYVNPVIPQIKEVYDESNHVEGMSLIIEVDKAINTDLVLKLLFEKTPLQSNFNAIFNVTEGKTLYENIDLKTLNDKYIAFQKEIITRKTKYDLAKTMKRLNIVRGYIIVINNIDRIVEIIKTSKDKNEIYMLMSKEFNLNEEQITNVLNMKLSKLMKLEVASILEEEKSLVISSEYLKSILSSEDKLLEELKSDLRKIIDLYGDDRKTNIIYEDNLSKIDISNEIIADYNCRILLTDKFIKKHLKQSDNHKLADDDKIICDINSNNRDILLFFSNLGNRYKVKCNDLKTFQPSNFGQLISSVINLEYEEQIVAVVSISDNKGYMMFAYENGLISKIKIENYLGNYIKLRNSYNIESKLVSLAYIKKDVDIFCISETGKGVIFNSSEFEAKGTKNSKGNKAIRLDDNKLISCIFNIKDTDSIKVKSDNNNEYEFNMNDIATTGKKDENRNLFEYMRGKRGNKGNYLINTNTTKGRLIGIDVI